MITYVNSSNASRYSALFAEATKLLQSRGELALDSEITTLEEYFSFMGTLPHITDEAGNPIGKKYTILPLDEDVFDINANTRTINVPLSFKTNGISVQGDQIAEIIYFRIDRFFDATDLNEMDIYIQWEAPNGDKGVSKEWVRDIESEPGKIIFGWPLSADITEAAGAVKFAVRFYKIAKNETTNIEEVIYSFSTLTQTAIIKPALDFSLLGDLYIVDNSALISNRFTNSQVVGGQQAVAPQFFINLSENEYDLDASGKVEFIVHAWSSDGGLVSYQWKKEGEDEYLQSSIRFVETQDTAPVNGKVYYEKISEGTYEPYTGNITEDTFNKELETYVQLFERLSVCVVNSIGNYYAIANNRLGLSSTSANSNIGVIPFPKTPVVSEILNNNGDEMVRRIIAEPIAGAEESTDTVIMKVEASNSDKGVLSYQWYNVTSVARGAEVAIDGATNISYEVNKPGIYTIEVTNTRNNETASARPLKPCRITYPATLPIIGATGGRFYLGSILEIPEESVESDRHDRYEYQWMKDISLDGSSADDIAIENAKESTYQPSESGSYYVKVRSVYNEDRSDWVASATFEVFEKA